MAETKLNMQLLLRRDSTFNTSYKLAAGEPGFEVSTNTLKIGDGVKTWAELPIANKAAIDALIKVTDDKVVALTETVSKLNNTYATDAELKAVRSALDNAKLDKATYNEYVATRQLTDTEINTAIGNVDAKFANYRTSANQDVIDNGIKGRLDILEAKPFDTYATKTEVQNVDNKFANYITTKAQEVIDAEQDRRINAIEDTYLVAEDIADFETKENVKKVADDLAAYVESNDVAVADRYTKSEANNKFALKSEAYNDEEVRGLISTNAAAIASEAERAAGIEAGLRTDVNAIAADYLKAADKAELQGNIDTLTGVVETLRDGIDADKVDGVKDLIDYVDKHGSEVTGMKEDIAANTKAVVDEAERAAGVEAGLDVRITALEGVKDDYKAADTALHTVISKEIDDDVKAAIEAEVARANGAYDVKGAAADAEANAIADAASKYEKIGTAQGIVDGLKLGETYEPIGAETRAKNYTDGKVAAEEARAEATYSKLGHTHVVAEITDYAADVASKIEAYGYATDVNAKKYASDAQAAAEKVATDFNTAMNTRVEKLEKNEAGYATTTNVATAKQEAIDAAKEYANSLDHEDTTYAVAATENALEFTVTPTGKGSVQTVKLVAPTVDTGVMSVSAGKDIEVTPGTNGSVSVAHKTFTTGAYTKNPAESDKTGDVYMMTAVAVDNGHVTGANVQSLAHALMGMTFVIDGGSSSI